MSYGGSLATRSSTAFARSTGSGRGWSIIVASRLEAWSVGQAGGRGAGGGRLGREKRVGVERQVRPVRRDRAERDGDAGAALDGGRNLGQGKKLVEAADRAIRALDRRSCAAVSSGRLRALKC